MNEFRQHPPEDPDSDTIRMLQQREPEGLRRLLERHGSRIRWHLRSEFRALPEADVDDAINHAAHRAWSRAHSFDRTRGTLRAWFYVITRNCALELLRRDARQSRFVEVGDLDQARTALDHASTVDAAAETAGTGDPAFLARLRSCIDALPRLQRLVIQADLNSRDVADAGQLARDLGSTPNSIYASRSTARKALKGCLTRGGFDLTPGPRAGGFEAS